MKSSKFFVIVIILLMISACSPKTISPPTSTPLPTDTPQPTITPTPTQEQFETLGSPFASDCGDGIPRIWSNDSFNGYARDVPAVGVHGHVDIFVPNGCDVNKFSGEVIAPISGILIPEEPYSDYPDVYFLYPDTHLIKGIEDALIFAGIKNPKINLIKEVHLNLGHFHSSLEGIENGIHVKKGQTIGDIEIAAFHQKLAYQIYIAYKDGLNIYGLSPTLFNQEVEWTCVANSPYDCEPESNDY